MKLVIIRNNKLRYFFLPEKTYGNYWIVDDNNQNLLNVEADQDKWVLRSNNNVKILNKENYLDSVFLINYSYCTIKILKTNEVFLVYCIPTLDTNINYLKLMDNTEITIGNSQCDIIYDNKNINSIVSKLKYSNNTWNFETSQNIFTYINDDIAISKQINCGDVIFILGLKIIIGTDFIIINNPNNMVTYNQEKLTKFAFPNYEVEIESLEDEEDDIVELYQPEDYFLRQPRFKSTIEKEEIAIDPPPAKQEEQEMPLLLTIGPMVTMAMTSMVSMVSTITSVLTSGNSWTTAIPSMLVAVAMLASVMVWPTITRNYTKKQKHKRAVLRETKYKAYLEEKKKAINDAIVKQRQVVIDNNISLQECINIINTKKRNLWERELEDEDFLTVRIGIGSSNPDLNIKAPEQHFSLEDDELNIIVQTIVNQSKVMEGVPININLVKKNIIAVVGQDKVNNAFINGLILQLITFHSYDELKIVVFTNEKNAEYWNYMKVLPHCWDDQKQVRFFASNVEDMKQISNVLEKVFIDRTVDENNKPINNEKNIHRPYFLIITDDLKTARNIDIVKKILGYKGNASFSLIIKNDRLANLPGECPTFLNIDPNGSGLFENELVSTKQKSFVADIDYNLDLTNVATTLANIPLEIHSADGNFPDTVSFLQMYNVGKVEQLNSQNRWKNNNPTISLNVPIGLDENSEIFNLDLHEKYHGPHGLIAGMTGSGKSEFIITYILSLAVNFHPDEVQFILIDYKGGGLAGAFENRETGIKLPHLAGTITNLDTMEMKRSLSSIQSELRRRQQMFNEARDSLNESTIDIYKYQKLYRDGQVKKPISHLFIISDEFAELKAQQPDFMAQLIQTARIGRSLGVHLILATQKPAGVVDDQIWSNSKFRICLKVQDKSDSMDMIKTPEAAMLKNVGRFYLQVGYNEYFGLGQSAWCGAQYYPTDKVKKKVDNSIGFINNLGQVIRSVDDNKKTISVVSKGEELPNILKYLVKLAKEENISVSQLWLEKIPEFIYVENLKKKYNFVPAPFVLQPIIGEFDDPDNQRQGLLTLPLSVDGNTIIYGSTGSGKELLLTTIIYSLITDHTPDEVNFYILDYGAETLRNFNSAPHIGDVVFNGETEKVINLLKLLQDTIDERKDLFNDYNGDYNFYIKNSGKTLPEIVVIINNYEVFAEASYEQEELIQQLTREGSKYGISFIFTTTGTNSIKYRLRQNFKTELVLQMNDEGDYITLLGNTGKVYPSKIKGRGIIRLENVYEFQTAYAYKAPELTSYIKVICDKLKQKYPNKAPNIPILPTRVTLNFVSKKLAGLSSIPIGVKKNDLKISTIDIKNKFITNIMGNDLETYKSFINAFIKQTVSVKESKVLIFDTIDIVNKANQESAKYLINNFDEIVGKISNYINDCKNVYLENNYNKEALNNKEKYTIFIIGIDEFSTRLSPEVKSEFFDSIINGKDINTVNFVMLDTSSNYKKQEYEEWYKASVVANRGIWLGNGIAEQFLIKLAKTPRELRELIPDDFGYEVRNGVASLIKLVEEDENE